MMLRIYLIVEEGSDRVHVQTTYPSWYKRPADRKSQILAVDVALPDVEKVDRKIQILAGEVFVAPHPVWNGDPMIDYFHCACPMGHIGSHGCAYEKAVEAGPDRGLYHSIWWGVPPGAEDASCLQWELSEAIFPPWYSGAKCGVSGPARKGALK